jgi:hypothetical protein
MSFDLMLPFPRPIEPLLLDESVSQVTGDPMRHGARMNSANSAEFRKHVTTPRRIGPITRNSEADSAAAHLTRFESSDLRSPEPAGIRLIRRREGTSIC